ncbi:MAG: hypothetical protein A2W98_02115 [Bacteroidetes bacterium GWF2_33_38]|nr:MAG: hypothetical protein A2W98_02115 [Bacteroidetes bacterium GWF2_33_38]OFY73323.1 MAG: hypothetical protein A2265_02635 [Bacteroidetes bacterium RIFOXYA12_FULL_33_9]OFY89023.1 MAG: hypothetical protein A2236_12550 [Bacteroidetes bacterium RIFOXYA2_FULL_33_7]
MSLKYFTAEGCNVCKVLLPKIQHLINEKFSNLSLEVIDTRQNPIIAADNQVFTIPVLIIYFESKEYQRFVRVFSLEDVKQKLERLVSLSEQE